MATPHDALFRSTFARVEHARSLLCWLLPPPLFDLVDWRTLRTWPTAQNVAGLRLQHADLLFAAHAVVRGTPVLFLLEHKFGATPDLVPQLHRYVVHIAGEWRREHDGMPFVVPVVVHHGRGRPAVHWRPSARHRDAPTAPLRTFDPVLRLLVDDLERHSEAELLTRPLTALARLTLLCLRFCPTATDDAMAAALLRWGPLLEAVGRDRDAAVALGAIADYVLHQTDLSAERITDILSQSERHPTEDIVMSTADRLIARGRVEGRVEGQNEGRVAVLLRQLTARFGVLPADVVTRVRSATSDALDRLALRVLDAKTLADVFADA